MSFKATLQLDGKEHTVLDCTFSFSQGIDHSGKPTAKPKGGVITLTIESNSETELFDWMISSSQTKSGTIIFYRRDALSKMKELKFTDAYCVDYRETFRADGENPMHIQLVLSAKSLALGGSNYQNTWPA